jgi:cytochrome oxidase assembly protein ShyY1
MPPVFALALALMGSAVLVRWCVREVRRVHADIDEVRERTTVEPVNREALPTLKRDPDTGEYRPN